MKYSGVVISVADINIARKFYEELFGLELFQNYGINIMFSCGLSLQQDFDWLVGIPKEKVLKNTNNMELFFEVVDFDDFVEKLKNYPNIVYLNNVIEHDWGQRVVRFYDPDGHLIEVGEDIKMVVNRFISAGMSLDEISIKMDVSIKDLNALLNS